MSEDDDHRRMFPMTAAGLTGELLPPSTGLRHWILRDRVPVVVGRQEYLAYACDMEAKGCFGDRVDETEVGGVRVSTVFIPQLALPFPADERCLPLWFFETMIFGGEHDGRQVRYLTWGEAQAGHDRVVEFLRNPDHPDHRRFPAPVPP
jgi:hypothetical protein